MNKSKPKIVELLCFLSVKHSVYLAELFQSLVLARKNGKSACMDLAVEYRGSTKKDAIFLITKFHSVIAQFKTDEKFLLRKDIQFENWMNTAKMRKHVFRKNRSEASTMVQDLRHGMKKVNVQAEVLEVPKSSLVYTRFGNSAMVTNAWIADETGKVKLCLWNEQANSFLEGDTIQIKNATVSTFKGDRQLCLGKKGTVTVLSTIGKN